MATSITGMAQAPLHVVVHDGPYVSYGKGSICVRTIMNDHGNLSVRTDTMSLDKKSSLVLSVPAGREGKVLQVPLKKEIEKEKPEYKKVSRQFILADIEANFNAFYTLLKAGGVIDEQFNWTFGDGHLVLVGDFVDRGEEQTEVLWLIYALEDKARAAGGYVHYVLGNHEIMNLGGDLRYLNPKYTQTAAALGCSYRDLLGPETELGRWLRSKNIVEKVGDVLYVHGGISAEVLALGLSLKQINELARPHYADSTYHFKDNRAGLLFQNEGPFWYRGFYTAPRSSQQQVDAVLAKYNARHIVTGHTVVDNSISSWYEGRVLNADVPHAKGFSEGLYYAEGQFYRVNTAGERLPPLVK